VVCSDWDTVQQSYSSTVQIENMRTDRGNEEYPSSSSKHPNLLSNTWWEQRNGQSSLPLTIPNIVLNKELFGSQPTRGT
jgi:hypothetical protein